MQDMARILSQVSPLVEEVASFIRLEAGKVDPEQIEVKAMNSLVSYVDTRAERQLVAGLQQILPGSGFLTEEGTIEHRRETYTWIVDPLDGTTNFLHGIQAYSISIGLLYQDRIILGVVYDIAHRENYTALLGDGAYRNEERIHVSPRGDLKDCLLATGFPYTEFAFLDEYMQILKRSMQATRGIRRIGSAALDLAWVACGRFDLFFEYGLNPWDVAAGSLLVQEAGGRVSDFQGGDDFLFGRQILAGNSPAHQSSSAWWKQA